jgi:hypothetical protein
MGIGVFDDDHRPWAVDDLFGVAEVEGGDIRLTEAGQNPV